MGKSITGEDVEHVYWVLNFWANVHELFWGGCTPPNPEQPFEDISLLRLVVVVKKDFPVLQQFGDGPVALAWCEMQGLQGKNTQTALKVRFLCHPGAFARICERQRKQEDADYLASSGRQRPAIWHDDATHGIRFMR